jgi:late competence protein required for DNA uptake (superfamily II DNA/RNA helicase)
MPKIDLTRSYQGGAFPQPKKRCFKCGATQNLEEYPLDSTGGGAVGALYFCRECLRRGEAEEDSYL